jgi:hypothetical protein
MKFEPAEDFLYRSKVKLSGESRVQWESNLLPELGSHPLCEIFDNW